MPDNVISRCFTRAHWESPYTLDQASISKATKGTLCLTTGNHRHISITFTRNQKALVYLISTAAFLCSMGLLTPVAFALASSLIKRHKIKQLQIQFRLNPNFFKPIPTPTPTPPPRLPSNLPPTPPHVPPKILVLNTPAIPLPNPGILPPPPANGILVGLPNVGNTCWLNSVLSTLACSPQRDAMFEVDIDTLPMFVYAIPSGTPEAEKTKLIAQQKAAILELQRTLKTVIYILRTQKDGTVDRDLCKRLVNALPILIPHEDILALKQQEAAEALLLFEARFGWPTNIELDQTTATKKTRAQFYQAIKLYSSLKIGQIKEACTQNFASTVSLTFKSEDLAKKELVNLSEFFRQEYQGDRVKITSDLSLTDEKQNNESEFMIEQVFINLPKTLSINLHRNVVISEEEQTRAKLLDIEPIKEKCQRKIDIDANGCLVLYQCDPDRVGFADDDRKMTILPKFACTYQVATAIVHGGEANGGHYTCIEMTPNGICYEHDDSYVREIPLAIAIKRMKKSTFLTLRRIKKEELDSEQISLLMAGVSLSDIKSLS